MYTFVRLSKAGYYADFVFYPLVLLLLGGMTLENETVSQMLIWAGLCVLGLALWTLIEYFLHRIILHQVWPFRELHALHHTTPTAMIGTPTWLTAVLICGIVLVPLWWSAGFNLASGLTSGLILGYLWYTLVHHAVHHWRTRPGSYLHQAKRRHAVHHHSRYPCNFGVTTAFWDRIFPSQQGTHEVTNRINL
jgi:sterol desaturase/sphingolipid hydroxylase (fatty acid hydroxylase superfamily)